MLVVFNVTNQDSVSYFQVIASKLLITPFPKDSVSYYIKQPLTSFTQRVGPPHPVLPCYKHRSDTEQSVNTQIKGWKSGER